MTKPLKSVRVVRLGRGDQDGVADDRVAAEEPLEIRLHGRPFAVVMRTPGRDKELAAGFLLAEGVIRGHEEIGAVEHCRHPHHPEVHNVVDVYLLGDGVARLDQVMEARRNVAANASCGICGRVTIESLETTSARIASTAVMPLSVFTALPERLRAEQAVFDETGGLHAAALFTLDGTLITMAEDVGRHNAVDKVVGEMLLAERLPLGDCALVVSGRTSFEIVQKAWSAGIPILCAVSAPSSLAIEVADAAGITLGGFVRDGGCNLYAHSHRIAGR